MLRIGLTGGIGAGKSAAATCLQERGAVLIDSDVLAREVVAPGTAGLASVAEVFGSGVLLPTGELDRPKLGGIVFADPDARAALNAIVHPLVGARTAELVSAAPPGAIVVHDVPLLVENRLAPNYHLVLVVDAPEHTRLERLARTRGMAEADARARFAAQAFPQERAEAADVVIQNDAGLAELDARIGALWDRRLAPYAANLMAERVAVPPVGAGPAAAGDFARAVARLRVLLNGLGARFAWIADPVLLSVDGVLPSADAADTARRSLRGSGWTNWHESAAGVWVAGHADPGLPGRLTLRAG